MNHVEDGTYRFETQVDDDDDDFEIPDIIDYYIWGVHNPENVESSMIGYHELKKEDFAVPPVKTHDYNEVASILTLVDNVRTRALLGKRFHEGERFFLNLQQFLKENDEKGDKIAILVTDLPIQLAKKAEVLKLINRAKPDVVFAGLKMESFKRQFVYFGGNKRFNGKVIVQFSGKLAANEENSTKSNVTYKIVQKAAQMADKKTFVPEFSIKKGDAIRESLVFFISKEFDMIRDDLERKFDRVDAVGHVKRSTMKTGPRLSRVCYRCKNAGIENQRHPLKICPTLCSSCKTTCSNSAHCMKILRKRANESEIEKYRKQRREDNNIAVRGFKIFFVFLKFSEKLLFFKFFFLKFCTTE